MENQDKAVELLFALSLLVNFALLFIILISPTEKERKGSNDD